MNNTNLTPKQEAFCRFYAVEKQSQRQAYISAYGKQNMSDNTIDVKACNLVAMDKVRVRIKKLQDELVEKALWSKEEMINDLKDIANECKNGARLVTVSDGGDKKEVVFVDSSARNAAINAIKVASDLLGYKANEPQKLDVTVRIEDILEKVSGDSDY